MSWTKRITITKGTQEWKKVYQTALKGLVSLVRFHQPALGTPAPGADWCLAFPKLPARPVPLPFFHLSPSVPSSGIAGPSANKIWLVIFIVRIERWDNRFSRYRGDFWSFFEISSLFLMSLGEPDLIGFFTSSVSKPTVQFRVLYFTDLLFHLFKENNLFSTMDRCLTY